jgi:hypothetical protein
LSNLYTKLDKQVVKDGYQIDTDANEIRLSEHIHADSFYAGMRASEALREHTSSTRTDIPMFNDVLKDDADEEPG